MRNNAQPPRIIEISETSFESEVLQASQPTLVEFSAAWSRPCQILDGVLDELARTCAGSVRILKVNADDNPDLSLWYGVHSIPTLLFFVGGKIRARLVGTASKQAILAKLHGATAD